MSKETCHYLEAFTHGNFGGNWIKVKQSDVVKQEGQLGVFSQSRPFEARRAVTWYTSYLKRHDKVGKNNLFTMEATKGSNYVAVGIRKLSSLKGRGVAQLANDALCVRLTERKNNCDFIDFKGTVYLVSRSDIAADDELLVHYGWGYWSEDRCNALPETYQTVLRQHRELATALYKTYGMIVGNCIHLEDADANDPNYLMDIVSFEVEAEFLCPATGVQHAANAQFYMQHNLCNEGTDVDEPSHLTYTYVCVECDKACKEPFARFAKYK